MIFICNIEFIHDDHIYLCKRKRAMCQLNLSFVGFYLYTYVGFWIYVFIKLLQKLAEASQDTDFTL